MSKEIKNNNCSSLEIKSHNKGKLTKRILLTIFLLFVANVMAACSLFKGKKEIAPRPTPAATATQTPVATATPGSTPEPVYDNGDEFIKELEEKGYKYLIEYGDLVSFGKEENKKVFAETLFKLLDGQQEKVFAGLEGSEKEKEIQKYQQAILIYAGECVDIDVKEVADITERCKNLSEDELKLVNTILEKARKLVELSKNEPINGKEINSKKLIGKFSNEYVEATQDFLKAQNELVNVEKNSTYKNMCAWLKYFISKLVFVTNKAYIPAYLTENVADPQSYNIYYIYTDENGKEIKLIPIMTEKGTKYKSEETGEEYTEREMELFSDINSSRYIPSMRAVGLTSGNVKVGESQFIDAEAISQGAENEIYAEAFPKGNVKVKKVNP